MSAIMGHLTFLLYPFDGLPGYPNSDLIGIFSLLAFPPPFKDLRRLLTANYLKAVLLYLGASGDEFFIQSFVQRALLLL